MLANALRYDVKGYKEHNLHKYSARLQELGIMKGSFVSHRKMADLQLGAIGQMWNMVRALGEKLGLSDEDLMELSKQY